MARPGFYNDNEHRAYPFVYNDKTAKWFPESCIVDAGFIMGLDCFFDDKVHTVWLAEVRDQTEQISLVFQTNANPAPLLFTLSKNTSTWATITAESTPANAACAEEPIWSGFIVVGRLDELLPRLNPTGEQFAANDYQVEPARLQNLNKSYVRSISVGNFSRVTVPECVDAAESQPVPLLARTIVPNAVCLKGPLLLKEGYNCLITQTDRDSTLSVTASRGAGAQEDEELCENHGEVPLFSGETPPAGSIFLTGGPACKDLIFTLNGVGGSNVNIVGGRNIIVGGAGEGAAPNSIQIELNSNIQGGCNE